MGTWGTGISSNDTYVDIYGQFIDLYNDGFSAPIITKRLINENKEIIDFPEDSNNFWFAIADAQWQCKELDEEVLSKVIEIINKGQDLKIWKELGATPSDLKAREKVLGKFLAKIQIERGKPRKLVKKKLYDSLFQKGDCLTYIMNNGNYGGAFVLTDEKNTPVGINYIAITTIDTPDKPTLSEFATACVYVIHREKIRFDKNEMIKEWGDEPQIGGFFATSFKKAQIDIEVVGQLLLLQDYIINKDKLVVFGWSFLRSMIPLKEEYKKVNGEAKQITKLTEWTEKNSSHWLKNLFRSK